MYNRLIKVCEALEREKSNSKRWALTEVFDSLYFLLTKQEQEIIDKKYGHLKFFDRDFWIEDVLMDNFDVHLNSFNMINERFIDKNFNFYVLNSANKISAYEVCDICLDILNDMGSEYVSLFKQLLDRENLFTSDLDNELGLCINNLALGDSYIFLDSKISNNVSSISTLMHELGHAYENKFMYSMSQEQQSNRYVDIFCEVMSSFFGMIALDYCINNHIYLEDSQRLLNIELFDMFSYFDELNFVIRSILKEKMTYNYNGNYLFLNEKFLGNDEIFLHSKYSNLSGDYIKCLVYGYGQVIALYFFDIYRNDKKEGLRAIKNFISNQALISDRDMFDSIDLIESDFKFLDHSLEKNMSYMRKRYKW